MDVPITHEKAESNVAMRMRWNLQLGVNPGASRSSRSAASATANLMSTVNAMVR
jgi:hypothetical protein